MNERSNGQYDPGPAIVVEELGKRYRIGVREQKQDTLLQSALALIKSPAANWGRLRSLSQFGSNEAQDDIIWALEDISLTVNKGEVVGIIGRNGAGKSTLLKILSRITTPTTGRVTLNGRVSSLLEVGTGFHPELTGRENVYLNGTILGMSKAEVDRKFDEIVAFAEVEKFIDTPVKRYSSGMRMRLAFAVSAHLESEILLVDEVLAVGDAEFQEKCLNKMDGVARVGRTVLLVSHNMQVIQRLCSRVFLLQHGRLVASGPPGKVIETYLHDHFSEPIQEPIIYKDQLRLKGVQTTQDGFRVGEFVDNRKLMVVRIDYDVLEPLRNLLLGFDVFAADGTHIYRTYDLLSDGMGTREPGSYESFYELPADTFRPGAYYFELLIGVHRHGWLTRGEIRFKLDFNGAEELDVTFPGILAPVGNWQVDHLEQAIPDPVNNST